MSCSDSSIVSSIESKKRWGVTMLKMLSQDIDFERKCCVFRVAKNLREEKPEAYAPNHLGLGPYHHLSPHLYKTTTHRKKLAAIKAYLSQHNNILLLQQVVEGLIPLEAIIRASYDEYLDLDIHTLACILAIDGLYLLQFLNYYYLDEDVAGDVMMLENQIPAFILHNIQQSLQQPQLEEEIDDESLFQQKINDFIRDHSPFNFNATTNNMGQPHLLQCLYHTILPQFYDLHSMAALRMGMEDLGTAVKFLDQQGLVGASTVGLILSFVNKIPWNKIKALFNKGNNGGEQTPLANKIHLPSVSDMTQVGFKFTITHGITDIRFEEPKMFHLPVITIKPTSEVVLRNLVAYEDASSGPGSTLVLAEYLDLMCGIIHSANDVKILKNENIIKTQMMGDEEEIFRFFNGISKSTRTSERKVKSNVEKAIDNVNKTYNNMTRVKVKTFFKKSVYDLFKVLGVLISVVVLILLVLQAFCSVFGCTRWFAKTPAQLQNIMFSF